MDRTGIIVVTICALLLGAWFIQEQKYQAQRPQPQSATNPVAAAQNPAAATPAVSTTATSVPTFDTNAPESLIAITNENARYTFTSRGGGLKSVELSKYPDSISLDDFAGSGFSLWFHWRLSFHTHLLAIRR